MDVQALQMATDGVSFLPGREGDDVRVSHLVLTAVLLHLLRNLQLPDPVTMEVLQTAAIGAEERKLA